MAGGGELNCAGEAAESSSASLAHPAAFSGSPLPNLLLSGTWEVGSCQAEAYALLSFFHMLSFPLSNAIHIRVVPRASPCAAVPSPGEWVQLLIQQRPWVPEVISNPHVKPVTSASK